MKRVTNPYSNTKSGKRKDLGGMVNKQTAASISPSTVQKWAERELDISNISACCDVLKQGE